jgi:hypothetical protein
MKKLFVLLFVVVFTFGFMGCEKKTEITTEETKVEETTETKAEETKAEETKAEETAERRELPIIGPNDTLKVLTYDIEPWGFKGEDGKPTTEGLATQLAVDIFKEMGQKYELIFVDYSIPNDKWQQDLKTGKYHVWLNQIKGPDEVKMWAFGDTNLWTGYAIYAHEDHEGLNLPESATEVDLFAALVGKQIAVIKPFVEVARRINRDVELVTLTGQLEINSAVAKKEIEFGMNDLFFTELPLVEPIKRVGPLFGHGQAGAAFTRMIDPEIIDRYNAAYQKLRKKPGYIENFTKKYEAPTDAWIGPDGL